MSVAEGTDQSQLQCRLRETENDLRRTINAMMSLRRANIDFKSTIATLRQDCEAAAVARQVAEDRCLLLSRELAAERSRGAACPFTFSAHHSGDRIMTQTLEDEVKLAQARVERIRIGVGKEVRHLRDCCLTLLSQRVEGDDGRLHQQASSPPRLLWELYASRRGTLISH